MYISNKEYWNKIDEESKKQFKNTFKFSSNDINKFILLLRKSNYPHSSLKWLINFGFFVIQMLHLECMSHANFIDFNIRSQCNVK